jgi:hypothetical protein
VDFTTTWAVLLTPRCGFAGHRNGTRNRISLQFSTILAVFNPDRRYCLRSEYLYLLKFPLDANPTHPLFHFGRTIYISLIPVKLQQVNVMLSVMSNTIKLEDNGNPSRLGSMSL